MGSPREARQRGIVHFDEQRFFEAHECFEVVWKSGELEEEDRRFWRGVTQVAVGCCHAQRGNRHGASALLERAAGNLEGYPSPHFDILTAELIAITRLVAAQVREDTAPERLEFPKFPLHASRGVEGMDPAGSPE
jgi:predicted metal-dependent hydrolase